jgi:hypothetical protein
MTNTARRETEAVLAEIALTRISLAQQEEEWKDGRAHSRALALELITEHGYSVSRTSELTGHHRNTLKIWLDIWNAEHRALKNAK